MRPDLNDAFARQARACADLGSPFMERLMQVLPRIWPDDGALDRAVQDWPGPPGHDGAVLPLRIAGGLHALVLSGAEPDLARAYPGGTGGDLEAALRPVLDRQGDWLVTWIASAPQTNEVGRSAALIAAALVVAARTGLPLDLLELGASAGLNLLFDQYARPESPVKLAPRWTGPTPAPVPQRVVGRRGVDLNPLSPDRDLLRITAYYWPDQTARMRRLTAALHVARKHPVPVDRGDAADWLEARLAGPAPEGVARLVFHTIAFQYFPAATQARVRAALAHAGAAATPDSPLAHVSLEGDATPGSAALTLQLWPGEGPMLLARCGFHGEWIDWRGPVA